MRVPKSMLLSLVFVLAACAHKHDARTVREIGHSDNLAYTIQMDATRLVRGTGLTAVPAVARLVEENLSSFFRVTSAAPTAGDQRRELVAESPAPGFAVRVAIEARPDDYCLVSLDVVRLREGGVMEPVALAPYSVHYGLMTVRSALAALRSSNRPPLPTARFMALRAQASALAEHGQDPAIDEATFARTPRPLDRPDEAARYYAPTDAASTVRPE